ncbi:MAG TPA: hypothetical protein VJ953_06855 [Saprospiraceae bacterium]|nr:hypothetical protein [Saprospiraceae bacterium]
MLKFYVILISSVLLLGVVLLIFIPTNGMLAFGTMVLPILIIVLAYLILRSKEKPDKKFDDDNWYDQP